MKLRNLPFWRKSLSLVLQVIFCHYLLVFVFRCVNPLAFSLTPSIFSNEPFLKRVYCGGERGAGGVLREQIKTNWGRGEMKPITMLTLWKKIAWFFQQQIEFLLISCFILLKVLLKSRRHFFKLFFICEHINTFVFVVVYMPV